MGSDRFKFRVWNKKHKKYISENRVGIYNGNAYYLDPYGEEIFLDEKFFVIEQCTGIKDQNGKLIYDGDVVVVPNTYPFYDDSELNYIGIIEYDDEGAMFVLVMECVNPKKRGISSGIAEGLSEYEELEIIGNIHESKWGIK